MLQWTAMLTMGDSDGDNAASPNVARLRLPSLSKNVQGSFQMEELEHGRKDLFG